MPYVRAHYRKRRGSSDAEAKGLGCLLGFGVVSAIAGSVVTFVSQVVQQGIAFAQSAAFPLAVLAALMAVGWLSIQIYRWNRRRRLNAFLTAAREIALKPSPSKGESAQVSALRLSAGSLPQASAMELEAPMEHPRKALPEVAGFQAFRPGRI